MATASTGATLSRRAVCRGGLAALAGLAVTGPSSPSVAAPSVAVKDVNVFTDCHAHVFTRSLALADQRRYSVNYDATTTMPRRRSGAAASADSR